MPVPYEYDADHGIIHARPQGELNLDDIGERHQRVAADAAIPTGAVEFIHLSNVTRIMYDSQDTSRIPETYASLRQKKRIRATFFIAESNFHFGVARMVQTWFEIHGMGDGIMVVRSESEARRFLTDLTV